MFCWPSLKPAAWERRQSASTSPSPLFPRPSSSWKTRSAFDSWTAAGAASCRHSTGLRSRNTASRSSTTCDKGFKTSIFFPAIDRLSRKYPQMFFHLVAGDTSSLYRDVSERNIEFAVCRMIGRLPNELVADVLFYDTFSIVTSAKNPLTRRRKLTLADLRNEPWALLPFDSFFGAVIAEAFRADGQEPPRPTVASVSVNIQNELLATGRFLTVLPGFMLKVAWRNLALKALPVALPNSPMPIGLMTLKNRTLTPLAQLFIENVRALAKPLVRP